MRRLKFLASREGRQEQSLLLLEGTHLLQEVLRTTHRPKEIVATNFWLERHGDLVQALPAETLIHLVTPSVLEASLTTVSPDGVASLVPLDSLPQAVNQAKFVLALDRLQDPGNLGTLLRTALAAEVEAVWLGHQGRRPWSSWLSSLNVLLVAVYRSWPPWCRALLQPILVCLIGSWTGENRLCWC